jgi:hypothetical protein
MAASILALISYQLGKTAEAHRRDLAGAAPQNSNEAVEAAKARVPKAAPKIQALGKSGNSPASISHGSEPPPATVSLGMRQKIAEYTKIEGALFQPLFDELHLTPEQTEELVHRMELVHQKANDAQFATLNLSQERVDYDTHLRKTLSPEGYQKYMEFEHGRAARVEVDEFRQFVERTGGKLGQSAKELEEAIRASGAISTYPSHGPYDPDPNPTADPQKGAVLLTERIQTLKTTSQNLLQQIGGKMPTEVVAQVAKYYQERIQFIEDQIARIEFRPGVMTLATPEQLKLIEEHPFP